MLGKQMFAASCTMGVSQVVLVIREHDCQSRGHGFYLRLGRSPGGGHGDPLQYSCLEDPRDRGVLLATVHGVTKSWMDMTDQYAQLQAFSLSQENKLKNLWRKINAYGGELIT